ncbi:MAG TPA: uroporphyrinogen decarboxylase family protein [Candidatus Hydrogenedentes bacterium]|nr:uroporphyrinogen decarboxylase family protein [Candidatus Hydrogenedentota bacterium]HOV73381.1 uroporphyrinogen decarboxylase family protein [Candidatus Hydrogenedentota bacterium]HPC18297.1 uroporphyrinogen decarboxylase family protein [Candidatus Hydrogenedentota bacterium]HRT22037.1 uroporphyrinogen decarboxylase family protein [Candidatus Hydrogenedentota bacterium]HRT66733.1 uroporphyrinogen decarboxylase family protein [Candidatus Hydrogenedentota bacterium]
MTNRERILATLRHEQPDRTPYHIGFTQVAYAKTAEYFGDPDFGAKLGNCFTMLGTAPSGAWREVEPDIWQDQFGVRWDRSVDKDIGVVVNRLVTPETLESFPFPDPYDPSRYANYPAATRPCDDRFYIAEIGFSLFERAWTLAGMPELLMAMHADKAFAHALFDKILAFNIEIIKRACATGIDAMYFGDDWGQQRGLIMGYPLWKEFIAPRIRRMYETVKSRGKFVVIHSCGKVDELFEDLISFRLDVFNPFQPEVIDVFEAKRRYGDRLCFHGGISTQRILPYATPDETREHVKRLIGEVGKNGGLFAAPAHAIPADAKPENIAAMLDVLQNQ